MGIDYIYCVGFGVLLFLIAGLHLITINRKLQYEVESLEAQNKQLKKLIEEINPYRLDA